MERCDFCAFAEILQAYYKEGHWTNQNDFIQNLFFSAYNDNRQRLEPSEDSTVSRWLSGQQKLRPEFLRYYSRPENRMKLAMDLEYHIFPELYDSGMAADSLYTLVCRDVSISQFKKKQLCAGYSAETASRQAEFIAVVLRYTMERGFVARKPKTEEEITMQRISPALDIYNCNARVPSPCKYFRGRDRELEELYLLLQDQGKVFLRGVPGIGKSELAKAYVRKYGKKYSNCLYIPYTGSLKRSVTNLNFSGMVGGGSDDERFQNNERLLQSLGPDSLLIVDNYNVCADEDDYLPKLMQYRCQILFTTRCRYREDTEYQVKELSNLDDLVGLVRYFYQRTDERERVVKNIIETLHRHTYAVELAARLLRRNAIKPQDLLQKLKEEKADMDAEERFSTRKDGERPYGTYYRHIHTLFSLYKLRGEEWFILMHLCLLPLSGVHKGVFKRWLNLRNICAIETLIEKGLLEELYNVQVMLHPMVQEITQAEFKPTVTDCRIMLYSMELTCLNNAEHVPYYQSLFQCIISIIDRIEIDDMAAYLRFVEDAAACMIYYDDRQSARYLTDELLTLLDNPDIGEPRDRALLLSYEAELTADVHESLRYAQAAVDTLPELNRETAQLASNLHSNLSRFYTQLGRLREAMAEQTTAGNILRDYGLSDTGDAYTQAINQASLTALLVNPSVGLHQLNQIEQRLLAINAAQSRAYADVLAWTSIALLGMGKYESGAVYGKRAMERFEAMFGPKSQEVRDVKMALHLVCEAKNVPEQWRVVTLPKVDLAELKLKLLNELL